VLKLAFMVISLVKRSKAAKNVLRSLDAIRYPRPLSTAWGERPAPREDDGSCFPPALFFHRPVRAVSKLSIRSLDSFFGVIIRPG
jgi:hypothetical protein